MFTITTSSQQPVYHRLRIGEANHARTPSIRSFSNFPLEATDGVVGGCARKGTPRNPNTTACSKAKQTAVRGLILQAGVDFCIQEALFHKQDNKISVRLQVTYDKLAGSRYLTRWLFWFTFYSSVQHYFLFPRK